MKARLYERHGVKEYWVVHPDDEVVYLRRLGSRGGYGKLVVMAEGVLRVRAVPGLAVDLAEVFADSWAYPEVSAEQEFFQASPPDDYGTIDAERRAFAQTTRISSGGTLELGSRGEGATERRKEFTTIKKRAFPDDGDDKSRRYSRR